MKPFAVFKNGKFHRYQLSAVPTMARFRVDLWLKLEGGDKIEHEISTKETISFYDFLEHAIQPKIDELLSEAGGNAQEFGFNCYLWG